MVNLSINQQQKTMLGIELEYVEQNYVH